MSSLRQNALYRPVGTGQTVTYSSVSVASTDAIGKNVSQDFRAMIVGMFLTSTTDCWVEIAQSPTAAIDTSTWLPAYTPVYFDATAADKIAVIRDTADGKLRVRPVAVVQ